MTSEQVERIRLPAETTSVAEARAFVWRTLKTFGLPLPENAALLTSEAVSNSVEHATTAEVGVAVRFDGSRLRVEVHDDDATPPTVDQPRPGQVGGYGLHLIDQLAQDWGVVEIQGDGKLVWFELPLPTGAPPP